MWGKLDSKKEFRTQLTWGQFKKQVEDAGIKNDDPIWFIDVHMVYADEKVRIEHMNGMGYQIEC